MGVSDLKPVAVAAVVAAIAVAPAAVGAGVERPDPATSCAGRQATVLGSSEDETLEGTPVVVGWA